MNGSLLYFLPTLRNSFILNKGIPKSRSLPDLEMILKSPSDDLHVQHCNSLSSVLTIDSTLLSSASGVEPEPFNTWEEGQVAASIRKQKNKHSAPVNLHQNIKGTSNAFMPTKFPSNFNDNETSSPSFLHAVFQNESKEFTYGKSLSLLLTKGHGNEACSPPNPDASKMQANMTISLTTSSKASSMDNSETGIKQELLMPSVTEGIASATSYQKVSVACAENGRNISRITSLVFFDLETTGLASTIGKSNVQITEVSMIAINRKEFEESTYEDLRDIRIIQKLCLCTKPRSKVSSSAAAVTGLNNENLMDQTPFERTAAEAINFFLSHLPKPVCLLAHNGNCYDFPILKAEFSRLYMSLPSDILIADTLKACRVLGVPKLPPEKKICESVKFTKIGKVSCSLQNLHLYFFNKDPIGSHSSEGDCIALARVCHRMKDVMLVWIDENCTTFDSILPMW